MNGIEALWMSSAVQAMAWALVHFLWQGAAVGLVAYGTLALLAKGKPATRYGVAAAALLILLACPIVTALWISGAAEAPQTSQVHAETAPSLAVAERVPSESPVRSREPLPGSAGILAGSSSALPWVFSLWLAGVAGLSLYHLGGWHQARSLRRRGTRPASGDWGARLQTLARRMRIGRTVELLESAVTPVPSVVGWLRPVVLVPASALAGLSPQQLEAILAHELAHVRRNDYLVNLLQTAVETLLFYHPAVWWVSAQMRRERENCCDDLAVAVCGDRLGYARALADLEGLRLTPPRLALAADGGSLLQRVRRLVGAPASGPRRSWAAGALALSLLPAGTALQLVHPSAPEPEMEGPSSSVRLAAAEAPASGRAQAGRRGTWSLERQADGKVWLEMKRRSEDGRHNYSSSTTFPASELQGLGAGPDVRFEIRRDAGTFRFEGRMEGRQGTGFFTFEGNPAYAREMSALGYQVPEHRLEELALHDVSLGFVREIHELGYADAKLDKLVEFRIHGVSPAFIRAMTSLGYRDLPADRLVEFRIHGVTADFVRGLQGLGYQTLPAERLVEFRIHGVSPDFVRKLHELGYRNLAPERLVEFRIHGVTPEFIRGMADASYRYLPSGRTVELHGVDKSVTRITDTGYQSFSPEQLVEFRIHGVTPQYLEEIAKFGYRDLPAKRLVEFRIHGINGEFIRRAASRGYKNLSAEDLVELKIRGRLDRGR